MKKKIIYLMCSFLLISFISIAQTPNKTETFKVYGNCGMCKKTIESSLKKKDGVVSKQWDVNTKMLTVTYDPSKITIQQIGQKVADVGYDNQYTTAPDAKYTALDGCCQYDRPKKTNSVLTKNGSKTHISFITQ